jgi:hypothetical protein
MARKRKSSPDNITIRNNKDENDDKDLKAISAFSGVDLSQSDIRDVNEILYRHQPLDENDMFGRIDISLCLQDKIKSKQWPMIASVAMVPTEDAIDIAYANLASAMLRQYTKCLVDKNIMLPPTALSKNNLIDISRISFDKEKSATTEKPSVHLEDDDLETLQSGGWKVFLPYFDKCFFRINRNRYLYTEVKEVNKKSKTIKLFTQCYIGDKSVWILLTQADITLSFEKQNGTGLPCTVDVENSMIYEQVLTMCLKDMQWDAQHKQFWRDMFDIPKNWNEISIAYLTDPDAKSDYDAELTAHICMLYEKREQKIIQKVFGSCAEISSDNESINAQIGRQARESMAPDYVLAMSAIYLQLQKCPEPESEKDKPNNLKEQKFGKMSVISAESIKRKD